jgi:Rieske Fe-S protein
VSFEGNRTFRSIIGNVVRQMNRREFIRSFVVTAALVVAAGAGLVGIGDLFENNQNTNILPTIQDQNSSIATLTQSETSSRLSSQTGTTSAVPSGYSLVAQLAQLSNRIYAYFSHPVFGNSILINVGGQWRAFSATCTHRPCTVQYQRSVIYCPCHGGTFSPKDGTVERGPPPTPLPEYSVIVQNSNVYVGNSQIN